MFADGQKVTGYMIARRIAKSNLKNLSQKSVPEVPIIHIDQDVLIKYLPLPDEVEYEIPEEIHNLDMDVFLSGKSMIKNEDYHVPMEKIVLHKDVSTLPHSVFGCCFFLEELVVSPENKFYKSIDGVLYSKDGKKLLCFPAGKTEEEFVVPEGVEVIGENSFQNSCVYKITMPTTLKEIEDDAFWFSYTKVVNFSNATVETVGKRIFGDVADMVVVTKQDCFGRDWPNVTFVQNEENL